MLTCTAIVGALGAGEAALWPAKGLAVHVEESVLLLKTEPRNFRLGLLHDLVGRMTEVGLIRSAVVVVGLGEDEDVVPSSEGILEDGCRAKVDIGVVTGGLVG